MTIKMLQQRDAMWKRMRADLEAKYNEIETILGVLDSIKSDWDEILVLPRLFSSYLHEYQQYERITQLSSSLNISSDAPSRPESDISEIEFLGRNLHANAPVAAKAIYNVMWNGNLTPKRELTRILSEAKESLKRISSHTHLRYESEAEEIDLLEILAGGRHGLL